MAESHSYCLNLTSYPFRMSRTARDYRKPADSSRSASKLFDGFQSPSWDPAVSSLDVSGEHSGSSSKMYVSVLGLFSSRSTFHLRLALLYEEREEKRRLLHLMRSAGSEGGSLQRSDSSRTQRHPMWSKTPRSSALEDPPSTPQDSVVAYEF